MHPLLSPFPLPQPDNILLTADLDVRVADVGLSFLLPATGDERSYASHVVPFGTTGGTRGYRDPYTLSPAMQAAQGLALSPKPKLSGKNDLYSFGVTLLELFPFWFVEKELATRIASIVKNCVGPWEQRSTVAEIAAELDALIATYGATPASP